MNRVPVTSSNLASVAYDPSTETLEIEFRSGSVYQYFKVPEAVYGRLILAGSKGEYFHDHIKDRYRFAQVA